MTEGESVPILFVDNSFTFGGAILSLAETLRSLDRSRFEPIVVTSQSPGSLAASMGGASASVLPMSFRLPWNERRGRLHDIAGRSGVPRPIRRAASMTSAASWLLRVTLSEAVHLRRHARGVGARLIHLNNNLESQFAGALASRLSGVPCVAHARGVQQPSRALRLYDRFVDRHVAISGAVKANLLDIGIPAEKIRVVPNGIDPSRWGDEEAGRRARQRLGIPPEAEVAALFTRIIPMKGVKEFVQAALQLARDGRPLIALVVGDPSDGAPEYEEEVRRMVVQSPLSDRIRMLPYTPDVAPLMAASDVVVLASKAFEGFGRVVIEAMASRKPVVATRCGGPEDVVLDGVTGFLVEPGRSDAIARGMGRILVHSDRGGRMGEAGRRRVEEQFSSDRCARALEAIYGELLPAPTPRPVTGREA